MTFFSLRRARLLRRYGRARVTVYSPSKNFFAVRFFASALAACASLTLFFPFFFFPCFRFRLPPPP